MHRLCSRYHLPHVCLCVRTTLSWQGSQVSRVSVQEQYKQWPIEPRMAPPPPPTRAQVPFEGTTTTRDAFQGWKLPPSFPGIGLEIVGDRMHTLIPRGANLPASGSHVFSTAEDGQREMCVLIYAGDSPKASQNELLGQFDLTGLPQCNKQNLQIEVCSNLLQTEPYFLLHVICPINLKRSVVSLLSDSDLLGPLPLSSS